jgi:nucleotide-binding universal stress UspA family protein
MISLKRILVPTDLSEYARCALPYAVELATVHRATLHLLHVVDIHWFGSVGGSEFGERIDDFVQRFRQDSEAGLAQLEAEIQTVPVEATVRLGTPHVEIVRLAREQEMDLIVIATHGRRGVSHALIGSVAEKVVQMAPCPVLSIKHPEHEFILP